MTKNSKVSIGTSHPRKTITFLECKKVVLSSCNSQPMKKPRIRKLVTQGVINSAQFGSRVVRIGMGNSGFHVPGEPHTQPLFM